MENPEISPPTYGHLIFDKGGKTIQWRKDSLVSSTNGARKTGQLHVKKNEIRWFFNTIHKISSKWIKDLNVRTDTIKP